MKLRIFQKGFNFRQDGPGNRLVYHVQGCNLHCPWCSNPEGMPSNGGAEIAVADLVAECCRSRKFFFGGGGVTFTGGEAMCQADALGEALARLQDEGVQTALETNGTSPRLLELAQAVDYLIMDFKHVDETAFDATCGDGFGQLARNYAVLAIGRPQLHVRIPLVNGFNADAAEAFADYFAARTATSVVFEFLDYHEYGKDKWREPYRVTNGFVTADQHQRFVAAFAARGLRVIAT